MKKVIAVVLTMALGSPCMAGKLDLNYKSGGGSGGNYNVSFKDATQPKYIPYWIVTAAMIAGSILIYNNNRDGQWLRKK